MMFAYLAVPQKTCGWLLSSAPRRQAISRNLGPLVGQSSLSTGVLAVGPIRLAGIAKHSLLVLWHQDYITGEGFEHWGIAKLSGEDGLLNEPEICDEVFERFLAVADARLQGLLLDDRFIHRSFGDDLHTCLAGRGDSARRYSLAYCDRSLRIGTVRAPALTSIGPTEAIYEVAVRRLADQRARLESAIVAANEFLYSAHRRPNIDSASYAELRQAFHQAGKVSEPIHGPVAVVPSLGELDDNAGGLDYSGWIAANSPLSAAQRAILEQDVILRQPLRILGPAGSGKTLLMQLLAIRRLVDAEEKKASCVILFIVHNQAMAEMVFSRFIDLGVSRFLEGVDRKLSVMTLSGYCREVLADDEVPVIDVDAAETKRFQLAMVLENLRKLFKEYDGKLDDREHYPLIRQIYQKADLQGVFAEILVAEFGIAIKSRGLNYDKEKYVYSEAPLSRLHSILTTAERDFVFDVFVSYSRFITDESGLLDPDDLAITMLSRLRTPLWQIKRKKIGFDFVFIDETQLFNENERRLFTLLTKGTANHVPVVLALDEAQSLSQLSIAGFGTMGIQSLADESLSTVFRSTVSILKLAFFVIQRSTDLFGPEFPDFTRSAASIISDDHRLAQPPIIRCGGQLRGPLGKTVIKVAGELRSANLRQVAVIVHTERYWDNIIAELRASRLPLLVLSTRGEKIDPTQALIVVSKPEFVGGQEFDAVIAVGLEEGLVPPQVSGQDSLQAGLEQRALREMYVAFTRARYRLVVLNSTGSHLTPVLRDAVKAQLILHAKAP